MYALPWQVEFAASTPPTSATILTGDAGMGAGELALELAHRACGTAEGVPADAPNPDLLITLPQSGNISAAAGREVLSFLSIAPVRRPRRVAVILRADRMHPIAANALLKTLEEPHENKSLLLWAPTLQQIPATLVSRCHIIATPAPPADAAIPGSSSAEEGSPAPAPAPSPAHLAFCGNRPLAAAHLPDGWGDTLAQHFCKGAQIDINAATTAFDTTHEEEWHWQKAVRRGVENGAHLNPHCLEWAEKPMEKTHNWLDGLQKWVADGVRVAHALPPQFFPAYAEPLQALAGGRGRRWLEFYRHLCERRALVGHPLAKVLFIKEVLYDYRHLCAH